MWWPLKRSFNPYLPNTRLNEGSVKQGNGSLKGPAESAAVLCKTWLDQPLEMGAVMHIQSGSSLIRPTKTFCQEMILERLPQKHRLHRVDDFDLVELIVIFSAASTV
jgi:hypothetical protein